MDATRSTVGLLLLALVSLACEGGGAVPDGGNGGNGGGISGSLDASRPTGPADPPGPATRPVAESPPDWPLFTGPCSLAPPG